MCGGDLTQECYVDEQYLLDLERETMVSLCGEEKHFKECTPFCLKENH